MTDAALLDLLVKRAHSARYVTSECTGVLLLGAASLLVDYDATTHWAIALGLEYDLDPPFRSGHPDEADRSVLDSVLSRQASVRAERAAAIAALGGVRRSS